MKKLALVVPSLTNGGGVPAVARFVKDAALRSGRYELKLISLCMASTERSSRLLCQPSTWLRGPQASMGEWEGLPFTHVGANFGELEFQRYRPRRVLTELLADFDLVQVVCGTPAWANTVVGLGKPVALQVATRAVVERRQRDTKSKGIASWWRRQMTRITDRLDDRALRAVDGIQVENLWMLEYCKVLNAGRQLNLRYAPPGVDTRLFCPVAGRLDNPSPYILCVARLSDPRKNVELLLEAYALLPAALRDQVKLKLAGSSGPSESFWQRAAALGLSERIEFVVKPELAELVQLYQHACVFALPSDEEGLGVVILEAMACNVPVVSTRSGGPDGIITDGMDGFLTPLDDAAAMAERLARLIQDKPFNAEMGRRARATIEARYAEEVAGQAFVEMWDSLLQGRV
ncbi:glycosyltransferase family 4 protein [Pseudomonas sp. N040]|uniref:glycosyltransferase family 4 protein n=1 Tax=Pseudomonas sp. N040 TaxID=2785325 RepID=UPI0018A27502|nr:glycosyltransferase family 4 protein [Pseudomonas sp. N040]MBF7730501.1 glycosyltransferase family 4 protein [Pseudomonas sp. N040]MBW7014145.1 glycosyltransferase family 4 protein [Pseudomonas sp. N040]